MMRRATLVLFCFAVLTQAVIAGAATAQPYVPENAQPRLAGPGWECLAGYRRIANHCERIAVPVNAEPDIDGPGWRCMEGYRRRGGACERIEVPANAALSIARPGWECFDGFRRAGGSCERLGTPVGAVSAGHAAAATCPRGRRNMGGRCVPFMPPANATYAVNADGWDCMAGYRRIEDGCRRLNDREKDVLATTVPAYGGGAITLADLMDACHVIDNGERYSRLACDGTAFNAIVRGCYASVPTDSRDTAAALAGTVHCPSPSLQAIASHCHVGGIPDNTGRALRCYGPAARGGRAG